MKVTGAMRPGVGIWKPSSKQKMKKLMNKLKME